MLLEGRGGGGGQRWGARGRGKKRNRNITRARFVELPVSTLPKCAQMLLLTGCSEDIPKFAAGRGGAEVGLGGLTAAGRDVRIAESAGGPLHADSLDPVPNDNIFERGPAMV